MATTPPTQPGIALTHRASPCVAQQTSLVPAPQSPTASQVPGSRPGLCGHIETILNSLDSSEPLRNSLEDLSHDYAIFEDKEINVVDTIIALRAIAFPLLTRTLPGEQMRFDKTLAGLELHLRKALEFDLSFCCLVPTPLKSMGSLVPLRSKLFGSSSRVHWKTEAPRLSILLTVAEQWHLPDNVWKAVIRDQKAKVDRLEQAEKFSIRANASSAVLFDDLTWKAFDFGWCSHVPRWTSGFDMYVWQLHMTTPRTEKATLYVNKGAHNNWQLFLAWTQTASQDISRPRKFLRKKLSDMITECGNQPEPEVKVISILMSMVSLVCEDSFDFRDQCLRRIGELRYIGRKRPSRHKMNFLLHLDDHRQEAQRGIRATQDTLHQIVEHVGRTANVTKQPSALRDHATKLEQQLKSLDQDLDKLQYMLKESRQMIKEQMDLRQFSLSLILTFVASVYLPFTFIAGMFGMNIRENLWPNHHHHHNDTKQPGQIFSTTRAIRAKASSLTSTAPPATTSKSELINDLTVALSAQPTIHLWTFEQFWWIAVAVTATTLLLPIIAGPLFRSLAQFSNKQKGLWRLVVFSVALSAAVTLALVGGVIGTIILGVPLGLLACLQLYKVFVTDQENKRWIFFTSLLVACMTFDFLSGDSLTLRPHYDHFDSVVYTSVPMNYWQLLYHESYQNLDHFYGWRPRAGLTGFLPTLWLFVIWFWNGPRLFNIEEINNFFAKRHRLLQIFNPLYWIDLKKTEPGASILRHRLHLSVAYAVAAGINICLSRFLSVWYLPFSLTASGLYALIRLSWALRRERSLGFWLAFAVVTAVSDAGAIIDNIKEFKIYYNDTGYRGFLGRWFCIQVLLPFLMLWTRHNRSEIIAVWRQMKDRFRRTKSGAVSTV